MNDRQDPITVRYQVKPSTFKALAYGIHGFDSEEVDSGGHGLRVPRMQVGKLSSEYGVGQGSKFTDTHLGL